MCVGVGRFRFVTPSHVLQTWILSGRKLHVGSTPARNYMHLFVRAMCAPSTCISVIILETGLNRKESRLKYFIGGLSVVRLFMLEKGVWPNCDF